MIVRPGSNISALKCCWNSSGIRDYATWEVVSNTPESILQALDIEARYMTSFWDALILQAAESAGASILYSEDFAAAQHYGSIQIVNPLIGR